MEKSRIICADAVEGLKQIADNTVRTCITSPPYYGLRDYGMDGQIGIEPTPEAFIERLVAVFREVKRVLKDDGTLWVNISDSYATHASASKEYSHNFRQADVAADNGIGTMKKPTAHSMGLKEKDMIGIPWMLAFALRADGWYLRSDIIWRKTNGLPEPVKDRPAKGYEHIFLLAKSHKYFYDADAVKQPCCAETMARYGRAHSTSNKHALFTTQPINSKSTESISEDRKTKNMKDVWDIPTNSYRVDAHFAMFPEKLVEPCILAGSEVGDFVLDPFFGSGTTGAVAKRLGRKYIGVELNPEYAKLAQQRIDSAPFYSKV